MDVQVQPHEERLLLGVAKHMELMTTYYKQIQANVMVPLRAWIYLFFKRQNKRYEVSENAAFRKCGPPSVAQVAAYKHLCDILEVWKASIKHESRVIDLLQHNLPTAHTHMIMSHLEECFRKLMATAAILPYIWNTCVYMPKDDVDNRIKIFQTPTWLEKRAFLTNLGVKAFVSELHAIVVYLKDANAPWAESLAYANIFGPKLRELEKKLPQMTNMTIWVEGSLPPTAFLALESGLPRTASEERKASVAEEPEKKEK